MRRDARWVLVLVALCASRAARAQPAPDVTAAAAAYQEAQQAQLVRDYARAAELFELADRAAPSPAALRSALRNHQAASHTARAASLALLARDRDAADAQSAQLAAAVLAELTPRLALLRVRCAPACGLSLDARAVAADRREVYAFFADPGAHALDATFEGRPGVHRSVEGTAGATVELALDAPEAPPAPPPPPPPPVVVVAPPPPPPVVVVAPPPPTRPLSPVLIAIGAGATAVAAGFLIGSGLDTLSARDAYVAAPTEAGFIDGTGRELRTNALIGVTAALGVATAVGAVFFTQWSGRRAPTAVSFGAGPLPGGAHASVIASF